MSVKSFKEFLIITEQIIAISVWVFGVLKYF